MSKDGVIKILDMGLARSFEERDQLTAQLDHGSVVGTADFISPEQSMGGVQDHRSDIYSLGATLYALLTGNPPYKGHTTQLLMQHQFADPPRLSKRLKSGATEGLNDVIGTMMAKKPADRFQSAEDVIEALSPFISGEAQRRVRNCPGRPEGRQDESGVALGPSGPVRGAGASVGGRSSVPGACSRPWRSLAG